MRFRPFRTASRFFADYVVPPAENLLRMLSPVRIFRGWLASVGRFFRWIRGADTTVRPARYWGHLLVGIPAILTASVGIGITLKANGNQRTLGQVYWRRGVEAMSQEDFKSAQLHLMRADDTGGLDSREIQFALAYVWEKLGYAGRAMQTFQQLAPPDRPGFPTAHRHLAVMISRQAPAEGHDNDVLKRWLWHLTNGDEQNSPEMQDSWGNYYLAVNDIRAAIKAFSGAASAYPQLYLTISDLHKRLGQLQLQAEVLQRSRDHFSEMLTNDPNNRDSRVMYASTLMQLGQLSDAEQVLLTGLRLDPEGPYRLLLASTFIQLHDKLMERGPEYHLIAVQQLRRSLEFDPNFEPALNRLLGFAQIDKDSIPALREILNEVLASGEGTAIGHLALCNLAWLENRPDVATVHLEQAIAIDSKMPVVANNLAWLLANHETPKLEQALAIAETVVDDHPTNARFLDTRGTILLKMGRHREALRDFEKALPAMPDRTAVHKKIAEIYTHLGMQDVADQHLQRAAMKSTQ